MKETTDFAKYLNGFLSDYLINEKGASRNTIKSYSYTFILLLNYMKEVKHIDANRLTMKEITRATIVDFANWLQCERRCCDSTRNQRLAAICSFIGYIEYMQPSLLFECQKILSIPTKKTEQKVVSYLTIEGIKLVFEQPKVNTKKGLRDLALLSLLYESGARVSELIGLTPASLTLTSKPYCIKLLGKGNKYRTVPLPDSEVELLQKYMCQQNLFNQDSYQKPLFQNYQGRCLTRNGVNNILMKYVKMARCKNEAIIPEGLSCHSLRHSKSIALLDAKTELIHIRDFLGHKSVITTERYARVNPKFTFEAIKHAYKKITSSEIPIWQENPELIAFLRKYTK